MTNQEVIKAIKKKFRMREFDNLPYSSGRKYTRYDLADLWGELGFNLGAEIGVRRGNFSVQMCKRNPNLHLWCIDPWLGYNRKYGDEKQQGIYEQCIQNVNDYNITLIRKYSMEALNDFKDGSLDFVFIDGNHQYDWVAPDIIEWSKKVRSGGIVSVHDYYSFGHSGVVPAVDGYVKSHHIDPWFVTKELEPTAFWVKP